jgi:hypothetical protein
MSTEPSLKQMTVRVLQMNDEARIENRQILAAIDEYPCKRELSMVPGDDV